MLKNSDEKQFIQKQEYIIQRLRQAGIKVDKGEKVPKDGRYSAIVGNTREIRILDIPYLYHSKKERKRY